MTEDPPSRFNKLWIPLALALLAALGTGWWMTRGAEDVPAGADEASVESDAKGQLARKKQAARAELEPAAPVGLFGTIKREEDGAPIEGAVVLLNRHAMYQGVDRGAGQPSLPLSAVTNEKGEWRIDDVPVGAYAASATARGYLPATNNELRVLRSDQDQRVDMTMLAGGHSLSGIVRDIGGGGIEGVLLRVDSVEGVNLFGLHRAPLAAVTDDEGNYEMFVGDGRYVISTYHPDYVAKQRLTQIATGPRVENLELVPGGAIEGVVVSKADGSPVENAQVIFQDSRSAQGGISFRTNISPDGRRIVTDAKGRFALSGLSPGVIRVDARGPHHVASEIVEVPLGIGETVSDVRVEVDPAFKVSGFVVPKGDPEGAVEGVVVGAYTLAPFTLLAAADPSDAEGYFEIHGLEKGTFTIGAISKDVLPSIAGTTVTLSDADIDDLIVELDRGTRITGRVEPAEVAQLDLEVPMENMGIGTMMDAFATSLSGTKSKASGDFDMGPVKPGTYKLVAKGLSGASATLDVEVPEAGLSDLVISLEPRASLAGRVVDESGIPVAGVQVALTRIQADSQVNIAAAMRGGGLGQGFATGEEGDFLATGFEAGEYLVSVTDRRMRRLELAEAQEDVITFAAGEAVSGFELTVVAKNAEIRGTVVDADGLPVADVFVTAGLDISQKEFGALIGPARRRPKQSEKPRREGVTPPDDEEDSKRETFSVPTYFAEQPVLTDQAGNFLIKGLSPNKTYVLVAEGSRGSAKTRQRGVKAGEVVTLELQAMGSLSAKVKGSGKLGAYSVTLEGPSNRSRRVSDGDPSFAFERLEAGEYRVKVDADEGIARQEVTIASGAEEKIEIELEGFGTVTGTLVDALEGDPIKGAVVLVVPGDGDFDPAQAMSMLMGGGTKTDRKGGFTLSKLKPGKATVAFIDGGASFMQGGTIANEEIEVEAGETLELGEVKGLRPKEGAGEEEQGTLGFSSTVAVYAKRPRPPGTDLDDEDEGEQTGDERRRLWVSWVEIDGPADEGGLEPGDEITSIDGQSVSTLGVSAARLLLSPKRTRVGRELMLQIDRQGSSDTIRIEAVAEAKDDDEEG